jgi:hypothetical protein
MKQRSFIGGKYENSVVFICFLFNSYCVKMLYYNRIYRGQTYVYRPKLNHLDSMSNMESILSEAGTVFPSQAPVLPPVVLVESV